MTTEIVFALYVAAEFEEPYVLPLSKRATEWLHLRCIKNHT
jgi:hypothetical protein